MSVRDDLASLLGADRVADDEATLARYARDTWPLRLVQAAVGGERAELPLCVVTPRSAEETAAAVAALARSGTPVVPFGGGSGVLGGAEPRGGSVVLSLAALDRIAGLDEENLTVTAQAGVLLGALERWLNERRYVLGHYPQSIELAQLGGLVATRSSGQFSTRYGSIEDLVLELEAVLPDGTLVRLGGWPRRSAGPDLRHLLIGSEGAFGVVTEVTLKVFPRPERRELRAFAVPSMRDGLELVRGVVQAGWRPAVLRLYDETEAERGYGSADPLLLVLSEGADAYVDAELRAVAALGARDVGAAPVEQWLAHRNDVSEFHRYVSMGVLVDTIDVAAPWSRALQVYDDVLARLRAEVPELLVASAHSSHSYAQGTSLYFVVAAQPARDAADVERVHGELWRVALEATVAAGGSIAHHHGIGKHRAPSLATELGSGYELLRRVKDALDPGGTMNPGTLLD